MEDNDSLALDHTPEVVAKRLRSASSRDYLSDFVLGAVDGTVTTFAVVAGVAGASLPNYVALILGGANLIADGFSMAVGNYLGTQADRQLLDKIRRIEEQHIDQIPEGEREEIRQIFAAKGFSGETLEHIVEVITRDRRRWVDTMLTEEFGLRLQNPSPARAALATFAAFLLAGAVPLVPFCIPLEMQGNTRFLLSSLATALTFFVIGYVKGRIVQRPGLRSGLETLAIGGAAAALAYLAGAALHRLVAQ